MATTEADAESSPIPPVELDLIPTEGEAQQEVDTDGANLGQMAISHMLGYIDKRYNPRIVISLIITVVLLILFIGAGVAGLAANSNTRYDLIYVQIGTTVLGFFLSIAETFFVVYLIGKFAQDDKLEAMKEVHKNKYKHPQTELFNFREVPRARVTLFFGLLFCNASIVALFWALTSILTYPSKERDRGAQSLFHFRFVDIIIGYVLPLLLLSGISLILITFQIITKYAFKPEGIFSSIMVFAEYNRYNNDESKRMKRWSERNHKGLEQVHTSDFGSWSIVDYFFYPIIEVPDDEEEVEAMYDKKEDYSRFARFLDKVKFTSWCFGLILIFNIILSLRVITNEIVIKEINGRNVNCSKVDNDMDCFQARTLNYIDCSNENFTNLAFHMDCFRYYSPTEIDPLSALIRAIFLFIAFEKFLQLLFGVLKTLYQIRYTQAWAMAVVIIGVIMLIFSIVCFVFYEELETGFLFLSVFQFFVLSLNIFLAGIILISNRGFYKNKKGRLVIGTYTSNEEEKQPLTSEGDNNVFLPDDKKTEEKTSSQDGIKTTEECNV